jgi:hypothetical protein
MVLVGPPGRIDGALLDGPTELDSLEQPARSIRGAKSREIRTNGSFFCNIPFVRDMTDEWLYCSDILVIASAVAEAGNQFNDLKFREKHFPSVRYSPLFPGLQRETTPIGLLLRCERVVPLCRAISKLFALLSWTMTLSEIIGSGIPASVLP